MKRVRVKGMATLFMFIADTSFASTTNTIVNLATSHDLWNGLEISYVWFAMFIAVMMWAVILGVGLFYHRALTHRAFKPNRWLAYFFVTVAAPAGTPIQWVGNHRHHHQIADTDRDPHSPTVKGFWVAHAGWYIYSENTWLCMLYTLGGPLRMLFDAFWRPRTNQEYIHKAQDIAADPYYAWMSKPGPYALIVIGHVLLTWGFVFALWGLWGCLVLYVVQLSYYVFGDTVNSLMHMYGAKPFDSGDRSTNLACMALFTGGEAYHNTHHALPSSANLGLLPGQFDLNYFWCRVFAKLGLASDIRLPSKQMMLSKLQDQHYRDYIERHF